MQYQQPYQLPRTAGGDRYQFTPQDVAENRVWAIFAYMGLLFLVPLLGKPKSPYAQYHAYQGINLFILFQIINVGSTVLGMFLSWDPTGILPLLFSLGRIVFLGAGVVWGYFGIYYAAAGRSTAIPLVGDFQLLKFKG